ncbi:DUF1330 domain-containing protein [Erythrobacter sp. JK5]|uniref:DUF1330 domain-containing protein n=1 Tax=Erythrobacter sp. JK5 TaxID=2829500 RepID=UPI001BAA9F9F|nr:DUF1330 domain-containing protein [Erythrobacter sp. JK5]QUL36999.1 DUF1330 domain-containing protein [Erythrobacter sp. JK5]
MPAYMIVTAAISDREKFISGYGAAAAELIPKFGGEYLLRGPGAECLEGEFGDGASMVISKWPDRAAAKAFWNSPEYAEAKKLREGLAEVQVLLIDGPDLSV